MRVAHIVSTFPPYHGGMGNAVAGMARALTSRRHHVTVITPKSHRNLTPDPLLRGEGKGEVSTVRLRPWFRWGNAALLPQLLWNLQGYDVVHLHVPFFGGAEIIAIWKQFCVWPKPAPLIITYQMDAVAEGWKGRFFNWYNRKILPWILSTADRIIVTSNDYAAHSLLAVHTDFADKIIAIPLGIQSERLLIRSDQKSDSGKPIVLFVGGLDRAHAFKGVDVLLRAFKLVTDFTEARLVIVGDGNLRPTYEALAKELEIVRHVRFSGSVSDTVLVKQYADATCVVLPSVNASEAFGMVLLEAMAAGKPVIASNLPGVRSVVVDGVTGMLVKPGDMIGLAKTITDLLNKPEHAQTLGAAGRKRVEQEYRLEVVGERLEKLYATL